MPGSSILSWSVTSWWALKDHDFADCQDLPPWRELVPVFTESIAAFTGQHLIAPQTVLSEAYWAELALSFGKRSLDIFHVLLHVDNEVFTARIEADEIPIGARHWRLDHIREYVKSRSWMESAADIVIDSTDLPAADVAERIAIEVDQHLAGPTLAEVQAGLTGRPTQLLWGAGIPSGAVEHLVLPVDIHGRAPRHVRAIRHEPRRSVTVTHGRSAPPTGAYIGPGHTCFG